MASASPDRRGTPRAKVFEVSLLAIDGREHRAHLLDVSAAGVRVHCRSTLAIGQLLALRAPDLDRRAVVRWVHPDGRAGLEFAARGS
ncbi:PilZ domain-containing protein [Sphingomonas guangdongensis]|uniref:PilZ domain-containing protein n=1 Tax=Sphingomonas guangdongensis TaxID=1141890 RepID=A0A285R250_9SPHN|nr:PilZ domain-containing protein [Sphingomonas guangdongensis]SOB88183.1 PilZ domain-containing protein [Sphingomonas guangdongensis]